MHPKGLSVSLCLWLEQHLCQWRSGFVSKSLREPSLRPRGGTSITYGPVSHCTYGDLRQPKAALPVRRRMV